MIYLLPVYNIIQPLSNWGHCKKIKVLKKIILIFYKTTFATRTK